MSTLANHLTVDCTTGTVSQHAPTPTEQTASDAHVTAQAQADTDHATLRTAVQTRLTALVGLQWTNMTAAQKAELVVALLYKVGALDKTLTVQPLANWL